MEFLLIFTALLTVEAAWYLVARRRTRRERHTRIIRQFLQSESEIQFWTGADSK